jgi:opacity protein-like surface antigen
MKKYLIYCLFVLLSVTNLKANYKYDDPSLGNIAIEGLMWYSSLEGQISNASNSQTTGVSVTDFENDLGYNDKKTVSSFSIDLKNDFSWIPNFNVDYFSRSESTNGIFNEQKYLGESNKIIDTGKILSNTEFSEVNLKAYGYLQQSIMEFNLGINLKKITYEQNIFHSVNTAQNILIKGPEELFVLPYIGVKFDLYPINTVLKAETSLLSFGDDEARSYSYSLNYRVMRHMYIGYGYRYTSFKSTNVDNTYEKYDVSIHGNYISAKILF